MTQLAMNYALRRALAWPLTDAGGNPLYLKSGKPATENRLGVDSFTPHDLRRTAANSMSQMGFSDEVIDAVLNHKKQGIIKVYNRNKYDLEKQQALEVWERKLLAIKSGSDAQKRLFRYVLPRKRLESLQPLHGQLAADKQQAIFITVTVVTICGCRW